MDHTPPLVSGDILSAVSNELVCRWDASADRIRFDGNVGDYLGDPDGDLPVTLEEFLQRFRPNHRDEVRGRFEALIEGAVERWRERRVFRGPDDTWMNVLTHFVALRDDINGTTVAVGTLLDADRAARLTSPPPGGTSEDPVAHQAELYRALAVYASDVITLLAPDGTILYESPSVTRVLGYRPEELVGRNAFELIHPDDQAGVMEAWKKAKDKPGSVDTVEYRCLHRDGGWLHVESSGRRPPSDAELEGMLIHSRDVTERKNLERQLREAREMEALGRLVSGIAHDVNNLLTVIRGNADLLNHELDEGDSRREQVEEILGAARRGAHLTSDLLAYGRQENLRLQVIDVADAIRTALPDVEQALGDEIEVAAEFDEGPSWVRVDPSLARHVLFEVVKNARDAMPDGGRLELDVRRIPVDDDSPLVHRGLEPGPWIAVRYTDTGTGMSREVSERAVDPFFSTKEGHSGLGLSTVYGLVKQSGGELWIESESGEGTTVSTYLPEVEGP